VSDGIRWSELGAVRESLVAQRLAACAYRHPGVLVEQYMRPGLTEQFGQTRRAG